MLNNAAGNNKSVPTPLNVRPMLPGTFPPVSSTKGIRNRTMGVDIRPIQRHASALPRSDITPSSIGHPTQKRGVIDMMSALTKLHALPPQTPS